MIFETYMGAWNDMTPQQKRAYLLTIASAEDAEKYCRIEWGFLPKDVRRELVKDAEQKLEIW